MFPVCSKFQDGPTKSDRVKSGQAGIPMSTAFRHPNYPLVVYTDLDGTLLDHDTYSVQAALPALRRLKLLNIPVIPVTSKTLAELETLTVEIGLSGPCIAENGGLIACPPGYFQKSGELSGTGRYLVDNLSLDYPGILAVLNRLRETHGFRFTGFSDLTAAQVAELTGLSESNAALARKRLSSEPLLWQDNAQAFQLFTGELEKLRYRCIKGGRFWHVMGQTDKATAIRRLNHYFEQNGLSGFTSIALGDSPNDREMLETADIAVVIRRKDGSHLALPDGTAAVRTAGSGPEGWNEFVTAYLDNIEAQHAHESLLKSSSRGP